MLKRSDNSIELNFFAMIAYINIVFLYRFNNIQILLKALWIIITYISVFKIIEFEKNKYYNPYINTKLRFAEVLKEILCFLIFKGLYITVFSQLSQLNLFLGQSINETRVENQAREFPVYMVILSCIIAPIVEEIFFRYLPNLFIKNNKLYISITAIVFAYLHVVSDPWKIIIYLPNSFYYGYIYRKTGNIKISIILHATNNMMAMIPYVL